MSTRHTPIGRTDGTGRQGRLVAVLVVIALLFATLAGRLGQVQLLDPDQAQAAARAGTRVVTLPAVRGRILDRRGVALADTGVETAVTVQRRTVLESADGGRALLTRVAGVIGRPPGELLARTHLCGEPGSPPPPACWGGSAQVPIPVATDVDPARALLLLERPEAYPGVGVQALAVRRHPAPGGAQATHVLGYLGRVTEGELRTLGGRASADDLVGRAGLEAEYDAQLRGTPGHEVVSVDPRGLVTGVVSRTDPVPGRDLVTSLDARVQARAERALADGVAAARARGERADGGAVVVLDVRSGEVVAAASNPTYDLDVWNGGISERDYAALTATDAGAPLVSRVTSAVYPPASTFKAVTLPAAVRDGADLRGSYACGSSYRIGNREFRNYESRAYGQVSLHRAVEVSCDTVFYAFAYRSWLRQGGLDAPSDARDPFVREARAFGFGEPTGVDLPGESSGRIPDRAWKREVWQATRERTCAEARTGYPQVAARDPQRAAYLTALAREFCASGYALRAGDAANFAIGQGDVTASVLQVTRAYAAIAAGGAAPTPRVGRELRDPVTGARTPLPAGERLDTGLDPQVGAYLRDALRSVVATGTARGAFVGLDPAWPVAGKTGTAEVYGRGDTAWFVGYAPAQAPRYAVGVVISQGGTGGRAAAPVARQVHEVLATLEQ